MNKFIQDYLNLPNVQFFLKHWIGCVLFSLILTICYLFYTVHEPRRKK